MAPSIQIPRAELSQEGGRIRYRLWMMRGSPSALRDIVSQAERAGEILALFEPESHTPMGLVKVVAQTAQHLGKTNLEEWVIHLQPEDEQARETLATLPEIHPDPY